MKTAAIVLIGHELLSGKIRDENGHYLMRRLRGLGVDLKRVAIIQDIQADIAREIEGCSAAYDYVFTSGGVGPTHDDITLESIAATFGVGLERNATLEGVLRDHFRERITDAHLGMADLPVGMTLIEEEVIRWPVLVFRNIYVLPGIPQLFRAKFEAIADRFRDGHFFLRSIYLNEDEANLADLLARVEKDRGVTIGSYPRWFDAEYRLRLTVEARAVENVNQACEDLLGGIEAERLVRVDPSVVSTDSPDMVTP